MDNKRQLKYSIKRLQHLKVWQLVVLFVLFGFLSATFLRLNNIGMVQRRDAVLAADKSGDKEVIKARLLDLQQYVSAHMNTDMSSIYLENQYRRDSQRIIDDAGANSNPNGNIYKKAQDSCAPKFDRYTQAYLQCTVNYLSQFPSAEKSSEKLNLPKPDMYRFSFVSPFWSPDFAGFSVLICIVLIFLLFIRITGVVILRILIKRANKG